MKYALVSDIHEDVVSLKTAMQRIEREGCNEILCLGDIVGFNPNYYSHGNTRNARECLDIVRQNCMTVIPGNHDLHAIEKIPAPTAAFTFPENWYQLGPGERKILAAGRIWLYEDGEEAPIISDKQKQWLAGLPGAGILETECGNILLSHYAYPNLHGALKHFYLKPDEFKAHKVFMEHNGCSISFIGHMHHPGLLISSRRIRTRSFDHSYTLKKDDCIAVPAVVDTGNGCGVCIFNTEDQSVTAIQY